MGKTYSQSLDILSQQLAPYINYVFNYFNGKVNVINSCAQLEIIFGPYSDIYAHTNWPNCVRVFSYSIVEGTLLDLDDEYDLIKHFNKTQIWDTIYIDAIKYLVIECIVHELFHIDQIYNLDIDQDKSQYIKIEKDVWSMTHIYITSNIDRISKDLGINYIFQMKSPEYNPLDPTHYRRLQEFDYYIQMLKAITVSNIDNVMMDIDYTNILYEDDNIELNFNNDSVLIKQDGKFITEAIPYVSMLVNRYFTSFDNYKYNIKALHKRNTVNNIITTIILFKVSSQMKAIMNIDDYNKLNEERTSKD